MYRAYILSKSARSPRFRTERENWVQRVVADGHAICILPERSAAAPGLKSYIFPAYNYNMAQSRYKARRRISSDHRSAHSQPLLWLGRFTVRTDRLIATGSIRRLGRRLFSWS